MGKLEELLADIDQLEPDDLLRLSRYVEQRTRTAIFAMSVEQLEALELLFRPVQQNAALMTDSEIDEAIDSAIAEVRRERKTARGH
jgi:hypothetical protein